jgi:hypothetical protein
MAKSIINVGVVENDGSGDTLRSGGQKINNNFDEIYSAFGDGTNLYVGAASTDVVTIGIATTSTSPLNVGVGTTAPSSFFTVNGDTLIVGILTASSISIGNTQILSNLRELQNIASLDATTTATIESAIANAPNIFTNLLVSPGISTFNGAIDANGGADISGGETVLSSATVSDLTQGRIVLVGVSGSLTDTTNLTYDTTLGLVIGSGGLSIGSSFSIGDAGIVTATTFNGNLTGTATTSTISLGLTGSPSITVSDLTATNINSTGIVTANNFITNVGTGFVGFSTYVGITSGTTWTVPTGVSLIKVYATGGGGGGAFNVSGAYTRGGGGATAIRYYSVSAGTTATYSIGAGGIGTSNSGHASIGGNTTFTYDGVTITGTGGLVGNSNPLNTAKGTGGQVNLYGGFAFSFTTQAYVGGDTPQATGFGLGGSPTGSDGLDGGIIIEY